MLITGMMYNHAFGSTETIHTQQNFSTMPTYDFINKKTGEITELAMSINELDKYKEDNPDMERYFGNQIPRTVYGQPKQSDGFKEVMSKVQKAHPTANLSRFT